MERRAARLAGSYRPTPFLPCASSWGLFPALFNSERRFWEYIIMNASTAALLDLFQIDRQAMDAARGFYRGRHPGAYAAGLWGRIAEGHAPVFPADYEAPDCPKGYETLRGYLARIEPETIFAMAEEAALSALCRASGLNTHLVTAPAWLARESVFETLAFPRRILEEYFHADGGPGGGAR